MARTQAEISSNQMNQAAGLELRNTSALMKQEHNYGLQTMGAQAELQNQFANQQYKRDLGTIAASSLEARNLESTRGAQERLSLVTAGEQTRKTDTNRITVSGDEQRKSMEFENELGERDQKRAAARSRTMARSF